MLLNPVQTRPADYVDAGGGGGWAVVLQAGGKMPSAFITHNVEMLLPGCFEG